MRSQIAAYLVAYIARDSIQRLYTLCHSVSCVIGRHFCLAYICEIKQLIIMPNTQVFNYIRCVCLQINVIFDYKFDTITEQLFSGTKEI